MIRKALSLAEFYKCSPYEFLGRDRTEIAQLFHETQVMLRERRGSAD